MGRPGRDLVRLSRHYRLLRYFFNSHRYSEDIDFDVVAGEAWKLSDVVDETIEGPALSGILRTIGIRVAHTNKQKQTSTTQRWKLLLATPAIKQPVSTKIEFSRRNGDDRLLLEAVPERVVAPYGLRPPTIQHYTAAPATEQKIRALAGRTETQARDVFDLDLLFRPHPGAVEPGALDREPEIAELSAARWSGSFSGASHPVSKVLEPLPGQFCHSSTKGAGEKVDTSRRHTRGDRILFNLVGHLRPSAALGSGSGNFEIQRIRVGFGSLAAVRSVRGRAARATGASAGARPTAGEHPGLATLIKGMFATFRNTTSHAPRVRWALPPTVEPSSTKCEGPVP